MTVHVEINGKPWCCWYDASVFRKLFDAHVRGEVGMPPICAYESRETAEKESIEVLRRFGVEATVVEGPCPEYGKTYEEDA
jgi:hypothetical protein